MISLEQLAHELVRGDMAAGRLRQMNQMMRCTRTPNLPSGLEMYVYGTTNLINPFLQSIFLLLCHVAQFDLSEFGFFHCRNLASLPGFICRGKNACVIQVVGLPGYVEDVVLAAWVCLLMYADGFVKSALSDVAPLCIRCE